VSNIPSRITIDIQQIAEIAGVGRSAVGNWRKRHADFPVPDSGGGFDLREVERWLIENGKIDTRVPPAYVAWSLSDTLRGTLVAEDTTSLLIAVLVYLQACEAPSLFGHAHALELDVPESATWRHVREASPNALSGVLLDAAQAIEDANPALDGLLVSGLSKASLVGGKLLHQLIDSLDRAADDVTPLFALFEEVVSRASELDRFRAEFATPDDVTELMIRLAGGRNGTVLDPACGQGGLLLSAAVHPDRQRSKTAVLIGYEINADVLRIARSRFFLYGVPTDLRHGDVFRVPADELPEANLVLVDPPLSMSNWGDAEIYLDERWQFGVPPRSNADLAWLQLAVQSLTDGGRAIVVTTTGTTFRGGAEAQIRRRMLEAGAVEAVIQLPGRLRADTSVPLVLWVLRAPTSEPTKVLLVDASTLGATGRSQHTFDDIEIQRIVDTVRAHEHGGKADGEIAWVVESAELVGNDAVLDPTRYRPAPEVNLDEVRRRIAELRSLVPEASADAADALERLLSRLNAEGLR